jgi:hypothetical protein
VATSVITSRNSSSRYNFHLPFKDIPPLNFGDSSSTAIYKVNALKHKSNSDKQCQQQDILFMRDHESIRSQIQRLHPNTLAMILHEVRAHDFTSRFYFGLSSRSLLKTSPRLLASVTFKLATLQTLATRSQVSRLRPFSLPMIFREVSFYSFTSIVLLDFPRGRVSRPHPATQLNRSHSSDLEPGWMVTSCPLAGWVSSAEPVVSPYRVGLHLASRPCSHLGQTINHILIFRFNSSNRLKRRSHLDQKSTQHSATDMAPL